MGNFAKDIESVVVDIRGVSCCMPPVGEFIIEMRQQPKDTVIEEAGYWRIFAKKVNSM